MSRNLYVIALMAVLSPLSLYATHDAPRTQGFAGAMRSGIPNESVFGNPAAVSLVRKNLVFGYYTNSRIRSQGLGGRVRTAGVYDGSNKYATAGFAYVLESRPRYSVSGEDFPYFDRTEFRLALGRVVWKNLSLGLLPRYIIRRFGEKEETHIDGDLGATYQVTKKIRAGLLYENVRGSEPDRASLFGAGVRYDLSNYITGTADYWRTVKGEQLNANSWAVGAQVRFYNDFLIRGGLSSDKNVGLNFRSVGLSYISPRSVAEISYKFSSGEVDQRDILFALGIQI